MNDPTDNFLFNISDQEYQWYKRKNREQQQQRNNNLPDKGQQQQEKRKKNLQKKEQQKTLQTNQMHQGCTIFRNYCRISAASYFERKHKCTNNDVDTYLMKTILVPIESS